MDRDRSPAAPSRSTPCSRWTARSTSSGRCRSASCWPARSRPRTGPASCTATCQPARLVFGAQGEPLLVETGLAAFAVFPGPGRPQQPGALPRPARGARAHRRHPRHRRLLAGDHGVRADRRRVRPREARRDHRQQRLAAAPHPADAGAPIERPGLPSGLEDALLGPLSPSPGKRPSRRSRWPGCCRTSSAATGWPSPSPWCSTSTTSPAVARARPPRRRWVRRRRRPRPSRPGPPPSPSGLTRLGPPAGPTPGRPPCPTSRPPASPIPSPPTIFPFAEGFGDAPPAGAHPFGPRPPAAAPDDAFALSGLSATGDDDPAALWGDPQAPAERRAAVAVHVARRPASGRRRRHAVAVDVACGRRR